MSFINEFNISCPDLVMTDHAVISLKQVQMNDCIARIPKSCILSPKTTAIANLIMDAQLEPQLALKLALMFELITPSSPWASYLLTLPPLVSLPHMWPKKDQALLKNSDLDPLRIHAHLDFLRQEYYQSILPLIQSNPLVFPVDKCDFEFFLKVSALVSSRAFDVDLYHRHSMVPLADAFNHRSGMEHVHFETDPDVCLDCGSADYCECGSLASDDENHEDITDSFDNAFAREPPSLIHSFDSIQTSFLENACNQDESEEFMEFRAVRECEANQELFNTYGNHSNAVLLTRYGFCELDNPFQVVLMDSLQMYEFLQDLLPADTWIERWDFWVRVGSEACFQVDEMKRHQALDESDSEVESMIDSDLDSQPSTLEDESLEGESNEHESQDEYVSKDDEDLFYFNFDGHPSIYFIMLIRWMLITDAAFESWKSKSTEEIVTSIDECLQSYYRAKNSTLIQAIQMIASFFAAKRLKGYSTSLTQDEKALELIGENDIPKKWALILLISEKRILKKVVMRT